MNQKMSPALKPETKLEPAVSYTWEDGESTIIESREKEVPEGILSLTGFTGPTLRLVIPKTCCDDYAQFLSSTEKKDEEGS